jgi:hypothetical protein
MSRFGAYVVRLRAVPRWYGFGFLMFSIWPLVLLYRYPVLALLITLPALALFFIATTGAKAPAQSAKENSDVAL